MGFAGRVWQDARFNIFWGVIFGMQIQNRSGKSEFQLRVGVGFQGFERPGCENRKGVLVGNGITTFYVMNFINLSGIRIVS